MGQFQIRCSACGADKFEESPISIIEMGTSPAKWKDYCFKCGVEELRKRLKGVPFTIEVPDFTSDTDEELGKKGVCINYTAEVVNY